MNWLLDCSIQIGELFPTVFYCSLKRYYHESFINLDHFIENDFADSLFATLEMGKIHHVFDPGINSSRVAQTYCWQLRLAISDTNISEIDRTELCQQLKKFFIGGIATSPAVV